MPVDVIVGLQWGDEGKGKIVDILAPRYKIVARFQGGPNAGHTLVINDKKYVFHTLPSGVIHPSIINVLGCGMVIDPVILKEEFEKLENENISLSGRLKISSNAHLILPTHRLLDRFFEQQKGIKKIGSTLKGISPAYQDKYGRCGIKTGEIFDSDFMEKYNNLAGKHLAITGDFINTEPGYEKKWLESIEFMRTLDITDTVCFLNNKLKNNCEILAEGAQGTLLDVNFGTYPFVTSSNTVSSGACVGLGIPPQQIRNVYGVFKAYTTRVGEGPFITEQLNDYGEKLRKAGFEYGSTTGRPRRCGWLDLVALNYSAQINGVTHLVITKSDVLSCVDNFMVCTCYSELKENTADNLKSYFEKNPVPQYKAFQSWTNDISSCKSYDEIPGELSNYLDFIEKNLELKISIISLGAERNQTIIL